MAFVTGQRLTADLLNQNFQGTTTFVTTLSGTWTGTETVGATFSASVVSGQTYAIVVDAFIRITTGGSGLLTEGNIVRIREDSLTGNQLQGSQVALLSGGSGGNPIHLYAEYTAVSTGAKTFVLTGNRNGTGSTGTYAVMGSASSPSVFRVQPIVN